MPRYAVEITYTARKKIRVWAKSPHIAEERACDIVAKWEGVEEVEAGEIEEVESDD